MKVLLVEDNEGDIELTKIAFKKAGVACEMAVAHNGEEAVDYLLGKGKFQSVSARPDFILLDLNMPRMGGKEFLEVVKHDQGLKTIPVIMLTSSKAPAEIMECYRRHANFYILKPSGLEALIEMAKRLESFWVNLAQLPEELPAA
ncbi:MAG: response regulator [Alphaproteobacteria bacterium]|nr:response regulator [Alphaproteobacteria bacterium]